MINCSVLLCRVRLVLLLSILLAIPAPTLLAQTATPAREVPSVFVRMQRAQSKPIPLRWKIAIVTTSFVAIAVALAFSVRAWRSSNLFDREYRFPAVANIALRLGANKSGGHMATIAFGDRDEMTSVDSTPEDS